MGARFGVKTFTALALTAVFVDVAGFFTGFEPLVEDDALFSSVFGGLLVGVGVGLIFRSKASTGGSDVLAMILGRFSSMPVGQVRILVKNMEYQGSDSFHIVDIPCFGDNPRTCFSRVQGIDIVIFIPTLIHFVEEILSVTRPEVSRFRPVVRLE